MKKNKNLDIDLQITIRYAKVKVYVDDDIYDKDELKDIEYAVNIFSREILIDKTYVAFEKSKYAKRFLTEKGWL